MQLAAPRDVFISVGARNRYESFTSRVVVRWPGVKKAARVVGEGPRRRTASNARRNTVFRNAAQLDLERER